MFHWCNKIIMHILMGDIDCGRGLVLNFVFAITEIIEMFIFADDGKIFIGSGIGSPFGPKCNRGKEFPHLVTVDSPFFLQLIMLDYL